MSPSGPVTGILLAAGSSRRMGERNKLLLSWEGGTIVEAVADALLDGGCEEVVAVLGHDRVAVACTLAGRPLRSVVNHDYWEGLSSSIRAGVTAARDGTAGFLIALGDMPRLQPQTVNTLIAAFAGATREVIVIPTFEGRRGNPVVFSHAYTEKLQQLSGDTGAKSLIVEHASRVVEVAVVDEGVLMDVDTAQAYASVRPPSRTLPLE